MRAALKLLPCLQSNLIARVRVRAVEGADEPEAERILEDLPAARRDGSVRAAFLGTKLVGVSALLHSESRTTEAWLPNSAYLSFLGVKKEFRGLGLSERLIEDAEQVAMSWEMRTLCVHLPESFARLTRVFRRRGFQSDRRGDRQAYGKTEQGMALALGELFDFAL